MARKVRPVLLKCGDCEWKGRPDQLVNTEGPSDLGAGEAKPVGACPECDWWFDRDSLVEFGQKKAERALVEALRAMREAYRHVPIDNRAKAVAAEKADELADAALAPHDLELLVGGAG